MKFILGKKLQMSQIFKEGGRVIPVTALQSGQCVVTQVKTEDRDGYRAIQVGYGQKRKLSKPIQGHLREAKSRFLREVRFYDKECQYKAGDVIEVDIFENGDKVDVIGVSKGKGFQGVVKRHGFAGQRASHGNKDQLRAPGSIGTTAPQRVFKGRRMAGHYGSKRTTVKNLEIAAVDKEKSVLYVKGAVPGARNSLVMIYKR